MPTETLIIEVNLTLAYFNRGETKASASAVRNAVAAACFSGIYQPW
jgi:hypothetical protein